jgi:AcrR family transcriptional regulator
MTTQPESITEAPRDTEERLLDSALTLFSEKGYEGTSIREIIEQAGVTRPVLYYYFANKEALFTRLVEAQFEHIYADLDEIIASVQGCRERLLTIITQTFEHVDCSPAVVNLITRAFFSAPQDGPPLDKARLWRERHARFVRIMEDGLRSGELVGESAETLALSFSGIVDMHVLTKAHLPDLQLTQEMGKRLMDLFFRGAVNGNTVSLVMNPGGTAASPSEGDGTHAIECERGSLPS